MLWEALFNLNCSLSEISSRRRCGRCVQHSTVRFRQTISCSLEQYSPFLVVVGRSILFEFDFRKNELRKNANVGSLSKFRK